MKRKVTILRPDLCVPFKNIRVAQRTRRPLPPIRQHWQLFLDNLESYHRSVGDLVTVIEKPLWQFDLNFSTEQASLADIIYIPHKQKIDFGVGNNALYYHQTVFPERFSLNPNGWGASMDIFPLEFVDPLEDCQKTFELFKRRIETNESKFAQPDVKNFPYRDYHLFVCQIPHDETIKYHSEIQVGEALISTIRYCKERNQKLITKGHPVNQGAMLPLKEICTDHNVPFILNASVHDCLRHANKVFLVNSGVGFEAMLHEKEIVRFGDAEYNQVTSSFTNQADNYILEDYVRFIHHYEKNLINSQDIGTYKRCEEIFRSASMRYSKQKVDM